MGMDKAQTSSLANSPVHCTFVCVCVGVFSHCFNHGMLINQELQQICGNFTYILQHLSNKNQLAASKEYKV